MDHREVRPSQISPSVRQTLKSVASASFLHHEKNALTNVSYKGENKMKKHSITVRIDEHLKTKIENTSQRTNNLVMSQVIRLLLHSSLDKWENLDDKELLEEVMRIRSEEWNNYDSNK